MESGSSVEWQASEVRSPTLVNSVPVVVAKDIPYVPNGHRLQTLSIYLPANPTTSTLLGKPFTTITAVNPPPQKPHWLVHIHGGAWRDPLLTSAIIEPTVAHAFSSSGQGTPITAIASINYTISPFPTHPTAPYDPAAVSNSGDRDPTREAVHPQHIRDVLHGLDFLRSLGVDDDSYILSGHSCGACIALQTIIAPPDYWGLDATEKFAPRPAAFLGFNGPYDLPGLVDRLGTSHAVLRDVYISIMDHAFGKNEQGWKAASVAHVEPEKVSNWVRNGSMPRLVLLDQSPEDQLVPMNQSDSMQKRLEGVEGLRTIRDQSCVGLHAAPWIKDGIVWQSVRDVLSLEG